MVLCVDDKAQIQALRSLSVAHGDARRAALADYLSHGTINLFVAARRRGDELKLRLVLDNYGTHKTPAIKRWRLRHPRLHKHLTRCSASSIISSGKIL
jgi:hypothetical protein